MKLQRACVCVLRLCLALYVGCNAARAYAQTETCPSPKGATSALAQKDAETRLAFIADSMRQTVRLENRFLLGWSLGYAGMASGTWLIFAINNTADQRVSSSFSTATAIAGGLLMLIEPVRVLRAERRLRAMQLRPELGRCQRLAEAERILVTAAQSEAGAKTPLSHTLNLLTNVGLGLILGYGLKQPRSAATQVPMGVFISELMSLTRPTVAMRRLESYLAGDLRAGPIKPAPSILAAALSLSADGGYSVVMAGSF